MASASPPVACGPEIRFQLASVSKAFTAAAILLLVDGGKLSVADPLSRYLDRCPVSWNQITIHHLLCHTAGLPHWRDLPAIALTEFMSPEDELNIFRESPLRSAPGSAWYYSSPGYVLLAHVVQSVADKPYREFLEQRIIQPLQLNETFAGNAGERPRLAVGHLEGNEVPSFELDTVGMGAGDVWSTVGDLVRWDDMLFDTNFLTDASRHAMVQV
ncbi:MAG TPA: serine hydrolase domain-containing protein, partial [Candidatus Dormibacteraeota bacterium]|nr:serine hydrolase domain-containing protein [Candidatus Dormibacteraeota bacterium]